MSARRPLLDTLSPVEAAVLVGAAFAVVALACAGLPVTDPDSFWIAAAGRAMWASHAAPRENLFSFTDPEHAWVFHEIGFGLLYAKGLAALGPAFLDLVSLAAGAVTLSLTVAHLARTVRRPAVLALSSLALIAAAPLFHPRPAFASFGVVVLMTMLAFAPRFGGRSLALAVALEWLWTMLHGSFPLGVALLVVGALDAREHRRARLVAALLAALVTLANPYGLRLHGLVSRYLVGGDDISALIHAHILEFLPIWRAPTAYSPFDVPLLALVTLGAGACAVKGRSPARSGLVLAFALIGAHEVRNLDLALLLAVLLLSPELDRTLGLPAEALPGSFVARAPLLVVPGTLAAAALFTHLFVTRPPSAWIGPALGGPDLLALLPKIPDGARVYAPFAVSSEVIWLGAPRGIRVLYDARNDCYSKETAELAFGLELDADTRAKGAALLDQRGVTRALVRTGDALARSLEGSSTWERVDGGAALTLFAKASRGGATGP